MMSADTHRRSFPAMVRAASAPIRVLVWIPSGMHRSIVTAALERGENIFVFTDVAPQHDGRGGEGAGELREVMDRLDPDVVVLSIPAAGIQQLVGGLGETSAVFVSADGRSAITYDGDVSADALVRMVHSIAGHGNDV